MKRFFVLFALIFIFSISAYATKDSNTFVNGVDSVYKDSKEVISTIYQDGKETISTVYNDSKDVVTALYPDIRSALVAIGRAIGVAAEHVYDVLVKQYVVIGVKQLCVFLLGLIATICGAFLWKRNTSKGQPLTYRIICPLIFMIAGIITMANVNYDDMFMGLINPEYGAINYITEYAKNLIKN